MKGRIFTAQEVQAIIAGNKTMFREITSFQPTNELAVDSLLRLYKPYQVGQMIFVKESFNIFAGQVAYKQSLANAEKYIWKPAQHMKQEQSRLTLQITEIRVERLKDISEFEAFEKEGMPSGTPIYWFAEEWNKKHKKPEEKFEANPWVWSIQFEVEND